MGRLGENYLGESRLSEEVWGEPTDGGQSVTWKQHIDLASSEDWPIVIDMQIVLEFLDPENVAGYNFTVDSECDAEVEWTVANVNNETGEVVIDVDIVVDCPEEDSTWTGDLRGDFDYSDSTSLTETEVDATAKKPTAGGDDYEGSDSTTNSGGGTPTTHPSNDWIYNPSLMRVGGSCTPSGHTATVPVSFMASEDVKEYEIVVEWDPAKLAYAGYNGTPEDYTDENSSQAYYFEDATIDASEGQLTMAAVDDDTISPYNSSGPGSTYDSGHLGSLEFNVLGEQGDVAELSLNPSATAYYDEEGREIGPENYQHGRINIENGLLIGSDTAAPNGELSVPISIQASKEIAAYDVVLEVPYQIVDIAGVNGVDLPDPVTDVSSVERNVSNEDQSSNQRKFWRVRLSASQDEGVSDPHICNLNMKALIAYFSAGEEGAINMIRASATAPDGSDIPIFCDSSGRLVITNPEGANTDSIPCESIDAFPVTLTRTFVIQDVKLDELRDLKVRVESDTNPTSVDRNWVEIPYSIDETAAAINATIHVNEPDGEQVCPADITTFIQFFWENGSVTSSGLFAGSGVHAGGVKGLFSGSSLLTTGNTRGNFGKGFQF